MHEARNDKPRRRSRVGRGEPADDVKVDVVYPVLVAYSFPDDEGLPRPLPLRGLKSAWKS